MCAVTDLEKSFFYALAPTLIKYFLIRQAYDNVESSMRKASVFCIVSLHQLAGEDLQPHLESLTGSKLKLLNLYIKRAQGGQFNRNYCCFVTHVILFMILKIFIPPCLYLDLSNLQ